MSDNVIEVGNQMEEDEGSLDRIVFRNVLKESTSNDMYGDIDSQDNSSCASNKSWDMKKDGVRKIRRILCTMMPLMIKKSMI